MKKKNIIITSIIILAIIIFTIYLFLTNRKYTYVCFTKQLTGGNFVTEDYLKECTTNKKPPEGIITSKSQLLTDDPNTHYILIENLTYQKEEYIYEKDFYITSYYKNAESEIYLLTELLVTNYGSSSEEEPIKYNIYIKEGSLYATNLNNDKDAIIFNKEKVKNIAVRPICCAGNGILLILTEIGNVYMSEKDCNYEFSYDFTFTKLDVTDIVSFKLIPKNDSDIVKNLYGINSKDEKILLHKLN